MSNNIFDVVREGDLVTLSDLIKAGCDVNNRDEDGVTLITVAASLGNLKIIKMLVDAGANVDQVNKYAQTVDEHNPLSAAAIQGDRDVIDYLKTKTKPKRRSTYLKNALIEAVEDKNIKVVQTLVSIHNVETNIHRSGVWSKKGWSILMDAAQSGNLAMVQTLVESGANVNYADGDEGNTPMMCAISSKNPEIVSYLLRMGANVNMPYSSGKTPLMKAAELGNSQIVLILIEADADLSAIDNSNKSIFWYAEKMGHSEIMSIPRDDI
jgi:ankyrin repeat protein